MEIEMDRECSTHGRDEECIHKPEGRYHFGKTGIDEMMILKWIFSNRK
jgi:hypothetical protein